MAAAAVVVAAAACSGAAGPPPPAPPTSPSASPSAPPPAPPIGAPPAPPSTPAVAATPPVPSSVVTPPPPESTTAAPAAFAAAVAPVTAADLGATWHGGCPVGPDQLRVVHLSYWGFDGGAHVGALVVNASVTGAVTRVFAALYAARFPIREMVPQSAYGGNDNAAAAADDTSGFNCRLAVASGPPQWSVHAYGEAIDVNDVENPYFDGATVIPPAGAAFRDRSSVRPGMAVAGGVLVEAFAAAGWQWGGRWSATPDYQHFSATGG